MNGFSKAFEGVVITLVIIGIVIGFILFVAIPWAWPYVKHFIHTLTA